MMVPKGTFVVGSKLMARCQDCGQLVTLNKFILGDLHLCLTAEEKARLKAFRQHFDQEIKEAWETLREIKEEEKHRDYQKEVKKHPG